MKGFVLAGGSGSRLWPLSRTQCPKPFLRLIGADSFLQKTLKRHLGWIDELYILTNESYLSEVTHQVAAVDPRLTDRIVVEPARRNTAPAIAYALRQMAEDDLFLIIPADHMIAPQENYEAAIAQGARLAEQGELVTFGIRPTRPETGYGYLLASGQHVEQFIEKPNQKQAQAYVESGAYFWNSGIFLFSKSAFEREARLYCPELIEAPFDAMPAFSLDYAIMEKSCRIAMVPLEVTWSDIGSWDNVYELLDKDEAENVLQGEVVAVETARSLVRAENRLVVTLGVENLCVVETEDVVLIAQRGATQEVKGLVDRLAQLGKKEVHEHRTQYRPWGGYTVLMERGRYKIKQIEIVPGGRLSLQMHYHRSEHWVVVTGTAKVTIGSEEKIVHEGDSVFVPKSTVHRVENPGKVALNLIEVQVGEYLGEDDILRFEDAYGRLKEEPLFSLLLKKE